MSDAMMKAALHTIRDAVEYMRGDPRFWQVFEEIPPAGKTDFAEWEEWAHEQPGMSGYRIPDDLRALYSVTGGFRWQQAGPGIHRKDSAWTPVAGRSAQILRRKPAPHTLRREHTEVTVAVDARRRHQRSPAA